MSEKKINAENEKLIKELLNTYKQEISALYGIGVVWEQLKDEAKDKCAADFDMAIEARELLLQELAGLNNAGIKPEYYEFALFNVDQTLLSHSALVKDIYGLDVKLFLNIKPPKGLLKGK